MASNINKKLFGTVPVELKPDPANQEETYSLAETVSPVVKSDIKDGMYDLNVPFYYWSALPAQENSLTELDWNKNTPDTRFTLDFSTNTFLDYFSQAISSYTGHLETDTDQNILE